MGLLIAAGLVDKIVSCNNMDCISSDYMYNGMFDLDLDVLRILFSSIRIDAFFSNYLMRAQIVLDDLSIRMDQNDIVGKRCLLFKAVSKAHLESIHLNSLCPIGIDWCTGELRGRLLSLPSSLDPINDPWIGRMIDVVSCVWVLVSAYGKDVSWSSIVDLLQRGPRVPERMVYSMSSCYDHIRRHSKMVCRIVHCNIRYNRILFTSILQKQKGWTEELCTSEDDLMGDGDSDPEYNTD